MNHESTKPNLFEYDNYRTYLGDLYAYLKKEKRHFSFRYFSKVAGFESPNFLQLVIKGKRSLSGDSIEKFTKALKLNKSESEFFRNLVSFNQAKTTEEKQHFATQVFKSAAFKKLNPLKKEQYEYYAKWFHIPVRELVAIKGFREDAAWIAKTLVPSITSYDAERALVDLEKLGLIARGTDGKLKQTDTVVSTGDEVASAAVAQFLKIMTLKGSEAVDQFSAKDRDVSSVTLTLSEKNFQHVKSLVQKFRKELLAIANDDKNPEAVYQMNFQLFPLTKIIKDGTK